MQRAGLLLAALATGLAVGCNGAASSDSVADATIESDTALPALMRAPIHTKPEYVVAGKPTPPNTVAVAETPTPEPRPSKELPQTTFATPRFDPVTPEPVKSSPSVTTPATSAAVASGPTVSSNTSTSSAAPSTTGGVPAGRVPDKSLGQELLSGAELNSGDQVHAKFQDQWWYATVVEVLADGLVKIHFNDDLRSANDRVVRKSLLRQP